MKKLFLASSFADVFDLFLDFAGNLQNKGITFIPTASKVEEVRFYVDDARNAFLQQGAFIDELDLSTASLSEITDKLAKNEMIYVSGGNTFFLLQELTRTGAVQLIQQHIQAGKMYIGESAGAMITAPNIDYVKYMDSPDQAPMLRDFTALNLVDFYVVPHYTNFPFVEAAQKIIDTYSTTLPLQPIDNQQAILVNNETKIIRGNHKG
ncbi:Type 1 glutamine amidotransferase-like domain-containing protein [Pasteurella multocida]|uniref:peptidase E n=1 Tax=Pasteurella multocida TaxID=747 RepID=UPI00293014A1|nr:Type 1 glutamine amidotransferase-like domain-containing protein [Pasteurella multocida]